MKIHRASASSIKTWNMCQYSYKMAYHYGLRGLDNAGALKGKIVHSVAEYLFKESVAEYFKDSDHIKEIADRRLLETFKRKNRSRDITLDDDDLVDCRKMLGIIIDDKWSYFDKKVIDVEKLFDLTIDEDGNTVCDSLGAICKENDIQEDIYLDSLQNAAFRIYGFIDLILEIDDDTIEIIDWKTGKKAENAESIMKDPQFLIYNLASSILYPQYKNRIITVHYLRSKPINVCFSNSDIEDTIESIKRRWDEIKKSKNQERTISKYNKWKCGYCSFVNGREDCDIFYMLEMAGVDIEPYVSYIENRIPLDTIL